MTKLTDDELAEKVATKVLGWHEEYGEYVNMGVSYWCNPKGQRCCTTGNWNPCNDWNGAMECVKALDYQKQLNFQTFLTSRLEVGYFYNLVPRNLVEWTLKTAGVDLEGGCCHDRS